jgi:uncharacterized Ntn-hydrolase superfamily protein
MEDVAGAAAVSLKTVSRVVNDRENVAAATRDRVLEAIRAWERAGFDHIALHQVGSDQEGFFRFWEQELQPKLP